MEAEIIVFVGLLLGIIFRTASPYLRKAAAGEKIHWENRYIVAALAALILCMALAVTIYPTIPIDTTADAFLIFASAFISGAGTETVLIEAGKILS